MPHPDPSPCSKLWKSMEASTFRRQSFEVLALTWNVNESKPDPAGSGFFGRLRRLAAARRPALVSIALQEIEMGGGSVALAAAKDALAYKLQEKGNTNAKFWLTAVLGALGGPTAYELVGMRQLSGMLVLAFARQDLRVRVCVCDFVCVWWCWGGSVGRGGGH